MKRTILFIISLLCLSSELVADITSKKGDYKSFLEGLDVKMKESEVTRDKQPQIPKEDKEYKELVKKLGNEAKILQLKSSINTQKNAIQQNNVENQKKRLQGVERRIEVILSNIEFEEVIKNFLLVKKENKKYAMVDKKTIDEAINNLKNNIKRYNKVKGYLKYIETIKGINTRNDLETVIANVDNKIDELERDDTFNTTNNNMTNNNDNYTILYEENEKINSLYKIKEISSTRIVIGLK